MKFSRNELSIILTKEFLSKEYLDKKLSVGQISKNIGCSNESVRKYLKKYSIDRRDYIEAGTIRNNKSIGDLKGSIWTQIRRGRKRRSRNLEFSISQEYAWNLFLKQDKKCALTGLPIEFPKTIKEEYLGLRTASLDRISSYEGYEEGNVQWLHKDINKMKMDFSESYFIHLCQLVSDFNHKSNYNSHDRLNKYINLYQEKQKVNMWTRDHKDIIISSSYHSINNLERSKTIKFNISREFLCDLYLKQKMVCDLSGLFIYLPENNKDFLNRTRTASLDRIDNNKHYEPDNVRWVHKNVNKSRGYLTTESYINYCCLVGTNIKGVRLTV